MQNDLGERWFRTWHFARISGCPVSIGVQLMLKSPRYLRNWRENISTIFPLNINETTVPDLLTFQLVIQLSVVKLCSQLTRLLLLIYVLRQNNFIFDVPFAGSFPLKLNVIINYCCNINIIICVCKNLIVSFILLINSRLQKVLLKNYIYI